MKSKSVCIPLLVTLGLFAVTAAVLLFVFPFVQKSVPVMTPAALTAADRRSSSSGYRRRQPASDGPSSPKNVSESGRKVRRQSSCPASDTTPPASSKAFQAQTGTKTVYLTFDDGPSNLTPPLLDVLDQFHVKATFFVVGAYDPHVSEHLKEIAARGHAIGIHSYSHNYRQIYASERAFFEDFDRMHDLVRETTGIDSRICRFPGGSVNAYNRKTGTAIVSDLKRKGYVYFDWNASSGDAGGQNSPDGIYQSAMAGVHLHRISVVLFHNTSAKRATLQQMPRFLETLKEEGYTCRVLNPTVDNAPFIF